MDEVRKQLSRIERELLNPQLPDTDRSKIGEEIADCYAKLDELEDTTGFEEFVSREISRAFRARQSGDRDKPLCTCNDECHLKRGTVPPKLRQHGDIIYDRKSPRRLATEYLQSHPHAIVMEEILDAWRTKRSDLRREVSRIDGKVSKRVQQAMADA